MAIEAELADGRILEFPDGTDPSVIQATVKKVLASSQPAPKTTAFGQVKEGFKGLIPGAVGLAESAAIGASALLPEDMEKSAREKIKSVATAAKAPFAAAPGYEDSVGRKLSEAVGSTLPLLPLGALGLAGRATAAGLGVGAGAGEARTRAEESGATGEQRGTATALGMIPGALEVFAPFRILGRLPDAVKDEGVVLARRALQAGGEEAAQEALSGFAQNLIAKGVYKPEQELIDGLGEQAAYGGATGAIVQGLLDLALGRRTRGEQTAPEAPATAAAPKETPPALALPAPEPQATPEAQAALPAPAEPLALPNAPTPESIGEAIQERERLKSRPQTADITARVQELDALIDTYNQSDVEVIQGEKAEEARRAAEDAEGRRRFPGLAGDVAAPTPGTLTMQDVIDTGVPIGPGVKSWAAENVVGKTREDVQSMVAKDPTLIAGKTQRAALLRELTAPQPATFEETPSVEPTPAPAPAVEQRVEPRASEPSVGVPSEPAPTEPAEPGGGVPTTAAEPSAPDGRGLVPAGRPAVQGDETAVGEPAAVTAPVERTADVAHSEARALEAEQQKLLTKAGRIPSAKSAARAKWDALDTQIAQKKAERDAIDRAQRKPAPAVETETADAEAARKAEAEDMKRRLEAVEKAPRKAPSAAKPAPAKPAPATAQPREAPAEKPKSPFDFSGPSFHTRVEPTSGKRAVKGTRYAAPRKSEQTLSELEQEIQDMPGKLGEAVRKMRRTGKLKLEEGDGGYGGVYDGKRATLYARGTPKGKALGMLLHEVGAHMGMRNLLGQKQYDAVIDRIVAMLDAPKGSLERRLAATALDRIPAEDRARGAEVARDELVAYFVEGVAYAEIDGQLPKRGPLRVMWDRIKTAVATNINRTLGTSFGINDLTPQQIADIATAAIFKESETGVSGTAGVKQQFSKNYTAEDVVNSMGDLTPTQERGVLGMFKGAKVAGEPSRGTKFRVAVADSAAAIEDKLSGHFNGAVRDSLGKLNPMGLYRQAQDYSKLLLEYFQGGTLEKDKATGQYRVTSSAETGAPMDVFKLVQAWGKKTGRSPERAEQFASRVIEAYRLEQVLKDNPDFPKHIDDADRALLIAEYNADPAFAEMNAAMDKPRIELIKQMVKVGRLSAEKGAEWSSVVGYVPFDRIDDFTDKFSMVKKTSGRSPLMLTKDPELKGSFDRPVGNVFENYLNTMGWMVGQVINNDARVQTLRTLEDLQFTGKPSRVVGTRHRTAKAYLKGEPMYWELPSSYDAAAFQELNPPKAKWLQVLGQASNVLRRSVTVLPPFALKQVTDDVQRAIMTSGVKNPGALLRMTLSNFGGLALAELRGIQHPTVKEFGALGLTGEYDFQQGKPAVSTLKDLGYRPRGKFETLMHRLDGITRASDLAVRKAIYDQTLKEGGDQLLAQTRAREFINFRRRGASQFVGDMVATIPFFNAYIQGMDVLYRAASGKDSSSSVGRAQARRMFWSRAAIAMTLSSLYALGKGDDDEDYNEMDLRTRDSNWILPGGFKIPVPGELGALFKVIPERIVEYMRRQGTPEEQEAWEATRTALKYIMEQYVERTVPIPQGVKPLLEAWMNYSTFTGRELEGIYQKQQDPSMRRASNTSELAIAISEFSRDVVGVDKISPIMIDNALNGYFGSTAGLLVAVTDSLLNPTRVDRPLHKYALVSNYMYDPVGTRRMTEFYDAREKVGRANTTLNELMKTDLGKAAVYAEEHADELMLESAVNSTLEQLERTRAYKKYLNSKLAAEDMTSDERADQIKEIREMETELTGWLREAKASLR